jgi:hypothetical protein
MPNGKKTAAKKAAAAKRKGVRYKKSATRVAKSALKTAVKASVAGKRKRTLQVRAATKAQTAENLEKAGSKALVSGKPPVKRKTLKVTPKSAHKKIMEQDKYYTGKKKARKARGK